jgi:methionyl aminopeptidase
MRRMKNFRGIKIKTPDQIRMMRDAGRILATIFTKLKNVLYIEQTTAEIDRIVEGFIAEAGVRPAFKGYRGFPGCACISVNEEIVHGIPGVKKVLSGDLVSIDIGIIDQGYYADSAYTFLLGDVDNSLKTLANVTEEALYKGIEQARPGNRLSDISHAVQTCVESHGFSVVREFVGHGIGTNLHEDPEIPNFGTPNQGPLLKPGMVFAIEPMVNLGGHATRIIDDGWTVVTKDGKPSAHFEHTVAVTESGPQILTVI